MIRLWIISMACCIVASCALVWSDDVLAPECKVRQTVTLSLTIAHPDASIHTRAALEYDDLTFSRNEAAVKKLTVFLVDLNADGSENYNSVEHFSTEIDPIEFHSGIYVLRKNIEVETGAKHVYVGANMKEEHIQAFIQNKPLSLNGEGPAVNMIMTPDPTHSGEGTDIVMFGQLINQKNQATRIEINEQVADYYLSADLERLTAKVLLTVKEGEPGLVATGGKGWVETDKIKYTLNVTNRHTFINRHVDDAYDVNIDPNWELGSWVTSNAGTFGPAAGHAQQFDSWTPEEIMARLFDERFSATPLPYDERKVGEGNSENHYTEGLYCLENTAYNNMGLSGTLQDEAARVATTHVVMAVRFIPRFFVGGYNDNTPCETLDRALSVIFIPNSGSTINGSGEHSTGTYWTRTVNGQTIYYAWTGVVRKMKEEGLKEEDFTCYEGGWSYFNTFVDGTASDLKMTYNGHESWGVQRDHYYILSIDRISQPGSPIPWDDYIRVNSETIPWVHRGSQEVIIKPKEK